MEKDRIGLTDGLITHDVLGRLYTHYLRNPPNDEATVDAIIVLMNRRRFEKHKEGLGTDTSACIRFFDPKDDSDDCEFLRVRYRGLLFWFITSRTYQDDTIRTYPVWRYEGR